MTDKKKTNVDLTISDEELTTALDAFFDDTHLLQTSQDASLSDEYSFVMDEASEQELRRLFETIFIDYLEPVRYCIKAIQRGENNNTIVNSFLGALSPLINAANEIGYMEIKEVLENFEIYLYEIKEMEGKLSFKEIYKFSNEYEKLMELISEDIREDYFKKEIYQKNTIPLLDYIGEIKGIGPRSIQKLYAAGLSNIDILKNSFPEDIFRVTGIPFYLCEKIIDLLEDFVRRHREKRIKMITELAEELKEALETVNPENDKSLLVSVLAPIRKLKETLREDIFN